MADRRDIAVAVGGAAVVAGGGYFAYRKLLAARERRRLSQPHAYRVNKGRVARARDILRDMRAAGEGKFERAIAVDRKNRVLYARDGGKTSVNLDLPGSNVKRIVHNHPSFDRVNRGGGFSPQDVQFTLSGRSKTALHAVTDEGSIYVMRRGRNAPTSFSGADDAARRVDTLQKAFYRQLQDAGVPKYDARIAAQTATARLLKDEGQIAYREALKGDELAAVKRNERAIRKFVDKNKIGGQARPSRSLASRVSDAVSAVVGREGEVAMAKTPQRPRNFAAMREDRVRKMAESAFGRSFATKSEAVKALEGLPVDKQHALPKPGAPKAKSKQPTAYQRNADAVRSAGKPPTAEKLVRAAKERPELLRRYARAATSIDTKSPSQALTMLSKYGFDKPTKRAAGRALGELGFAGKGPRPKIIDAADAVITDKSGNLLLIERGKNGGPGAGKPALPGGLVDRGENVVQAAIREAAEETGVKVQGGKAVGKPRLTGDVRTYDPKFDPSGSLAKHHGLKPGDTFRIRTQAVLFEVEDLVKASPRAGDDAASVVVRKAASVKAGDLGIKHHNALIKEALASGPIGWSAAAREASANARNNPDRPADLGMRQKPKPRTPFEAPPKTATDGGLRDPMKRGKGQSTTTPRAPKKSAAAALDAVTREAKAKVESERGIKAAADLDTNTATPRNQAVSAKPPGVAKKPKGGPRGFANADVQAAAQAGRAKTSGGSVDDMLKGLKKTDLDKVAEEVLGYKASYRRKADVAKALKANVHQAHLQDARGRGMAAMSGQSSKSSFGSEAERKLTAAIDKVKSAPGQTKTPRAAKAPTVKSLRADAKAAGIKGASKMNKSALMKALGKLGSAAAKGAKFLAPAIALGAGAYALTRGASVAEAATVTGKTGADILTGGALSAREAEKAKGRSDSLATTKAIIQGVGSLATFGGLDAIQWATSGRKTMTAPDVRKASAERRKAYATRKASGSRAALVRGAAMRSVATSASSVKAARAKVAKASKSSGNKKIGFANRKVLAAALKAQGKRGPGMGARR